MTGIIVLIIYALIMVGATMLMTKKEGNMERFCVGDRNIGWFVSALSIAATWIWAPALFTSTENAYTKGFAGLFWFLVPNVLCLILFIPFARKIRAEMPHGITLSGYMHEKYKSTGIITALVVGLPIFAYGNIYGIATYKTAGSLITVLSAGIVALIVSKLSKKEAGQ